MPIPRRTFLAFLLGCAAGLRPALAGSPGPTQWAEDFEAMWRAIDRRYAFMEAKRGSWARVRRQWAPRAARARSRPEFVAVIEGALEELRDDHVAISERTATSPRRIPADTDIRAGFHDGTAVVEAVRTYGDADVAGMRPGHAITRIGGVPTEKVVSGALGGSREAGPAEREWALNHALAGPWEGRLEVDVREAHGERHLAIERRPARDSHGPPVIARRMGEDRDLGYIRIKASLDDPQLPRHFDAALDPLLGARALILDLREVADARSHGATQAILGRFSPTRSPWQVRKPRGAARVTDFVEPRGARYRGSIVVLVDRWTAGEGEALAAGLNAVAGARLVGTPMAGLRGELDEVRLPHSGIVVRFPSQEAFHVNGTPRERLQPDVPVNLAAPAGGPGDPILYQALKLLEK